MDGPVLQAVILSTLAGITIPAGAFLARFDRFLPRCAEDDFWHSVIGFRSGALFSAMALGAMIVGQAAVAVLLAALIALQNPARGIQRVARDGDGCVPSQNDLGLGGHLAVM